SIGQIAANQSAARVGSQVREPPLEDVDVHSRAGSVLGRSFDGARVLVGSLDAHGDRTLLLPRGNGQVFPLPRGEFRPALEGKPARNARCTAHRDQRGLDGAGPWSAARIAERMRAVVVLDTE